VSTPAEPLTVAAVRRLMALWARLCDDRDVAAWAGLYAPDATLEVSGEHYTGEAIAGWLVTQSSNPAGCHATMNITVEADGPDRANSSADFVFVRRESGTGPWQIVNVGRYHDAFVRIDDAWAFAHRVITLR
jgi:hypothetical protein